MIETSFGMLSNMRRSINKTLKDKELITLIPKVNDIISFKNGAGMSVERAYVKELSDTHITLAFAPQKMVIMPHVTYIGNGIEKMLLSEFENGSYIDYHVIDSLSDNERMVIIKEIDNDLRAYADNLALRAAIVNAVKFLTDTTHKTKDEIYSDICFYVCMGRELELGKVYDFPDEILEDIAYNSFLCLKELGFDKDKIIQATGISDRLYNIVMRDDMSYAAAKSQKVKCDIER